MPSTTPSASEAARALRQRTNIFNTLALGLVAASAVVFLLGPAIGFTTRGARISLVFSVVTLVLGLISLWDAVLINQGKPTLDVTLPPPINGWIGGLATLAGGWLIGTRIFN